MSRILTERLAALGLEPRIHIVKTPPTASLPARAARVAEVIDATELPSIGSAARRAAGRCRPQTRNDGIVPTLSQAWGVVHAAVADHLDTCSATSGTQRTTRLTSTGS